MKFKILLFVVFSVLMFSVCGGGSFESFNNISISNNLIFSNFLNNNFNNINIV